MRANIEHQVLLLHHEDVPHYKRQGAIVRNTYFWALQSIADRTGFDRDWEFTDCVWIALVRMLTSFAESGYLGYRDTILEFPPDAVIPSLLRPVATWRAAEDEAG
jgi:hypothetical protein